MRLRKKQFGLTLHELMVGTAICSVLVGASAPPFSDFIAKRKVMGASNVIAAYLEDVKMLSIKRNQFISVTLEKSDDGTHWCIGALPGNGTSCDCLATTPECLIDSEPSLISDTSYADFDVVATAFETGTMTFDPVRGILTTPSQATVIAVQHKTADYRVRISVNPTGNVRKCTPAEHALVGYRECT